MFDQITAWITSAQGVISAIVAFVLLCIAGYWQIRKALLEGQEKKEAKDSLRQEAIGAITSVETGTGKALAELVNSKVIPGLKLSEIQEATPDLKHEIATTITNAKGKSFIEKLGKAFDVGMFVKETYQGIKPLIKSLRKK